MARSILLALGGTAALQSGQALAQQATQELERVSVTGSNVRRIDAATPSPVQVITADDMRKSGYTSVQDVLHNLTANGQGMLSQGFSGAFASGAAGVSLRGLTVGATLVLLDGHRMAPYPVGDDGQRSFVDIANIPFDAVERIEVLKDGASAVYGSDAIAGVVNIILKRSFVGKTFTADLGTSYKNDGGNYRVAGTVGFGDLSSDGHNFYVSGELRKQNQIRLMDRGGLYTQRDFTSTGGLDITPGVPNAANSGKPAIASGYVTDANGTIAGFMPGCDATKLAAGQCAYRDNWSQIQPATENYNLLGRYTQNLDRTWQLSLQASYFQSKSEQVNPPYTTFADGYQGMAIGPGVAPTLIASLPPTSIPSTNPSFPAGTGLSSAQLHYAFLDVGPSTTETNSRATRLIADLKGQAGAWEVTAAVGHTQVLLDLTGRNLVNPVNLQTALDSTTDPYRVGGPNSASVLGFIAPTLLSKDVSRLSFVHLGADRDLMELPGGPLSLAAGADYVHRTQRALAPDAVAAGYYTLMDSNNLGYSNNFTVGKQTVGSVYAELVAPLTRQIDAEAAVRYDHYNLSGGRASPKVGMKYMPIQELAVRGTASRGFRAPGPTENGNAGQTFFTGTSNDPLLCPNPANTSAPGNFPSQCSLSIGTVLGTNATLKPETSKSYTLGLLVAPVKSFSASLDFYSIEINNQIVTGSSSDAIRGTNFTPISFVNADGSTTLAAPPVAPIAYYQVGYINANRTKTSGVDLGLQFRHGIAGVGEFKSDFMLSYMKQYDLTIDGVTYHLAGTHGPLVVSGDTGNPKTRIQWTNSLTRGPWQITGTLNYIGSFDLTDPSAGVDDCAAGLTVGAGATPYQAPLGSSPPVIPAGVKCKVDSFTTFDLYGRYEVTKQFSLHASILNLFNAGAPQDWGTYAGARGVAPWNPSLHAQGAIGRYLRIGATYAF